MRLILTLFLALLLLADLVSAQGFTNAGTRFTFGIPEGTERHPATATIGPPSTFISVVAQQDGCGVIRSPHGFSQSFSFRAGRVREVFIDTAWMQSYELGKNDKGFTVETSVPANLMMHVFVDGAGDATQLWPDDLLGTDYLLSGWSIWNDRGEHNRAQFVVTSPEDNTVVTIFAPSGLLPDVPPNTTVTVTLNRGESYIGKMDTTLERMRTTSHVTVNATKPVSVILATTCAYVPYGVQSCNMMLDAILPRKYFGTEFYIQPTNRATSSDVILVTSDKLNFIVTSTGGTPAVTNQGRLTMFVDRPTMLTSSEPVMMQILTQGSYVASLYQSDPGMVTLLPAQLHDDTLAWYSPPQVGGGAPFAHYITVVGEAASFNDILLDDQPLALKGTPNPIPGSNKFAMLAGLNVATHKLTSPTPVMGIISGYKDADGYNAIAGGVKYQEPPFEPPPPLVLSFIGDEQEFCRTFDATLNTSGTLGSEHQVIGFEVTITYDVTELHMRHAVPGTMFTGVNGVTIDTAIPGKITLRALPGSYLTGSGSLLVATFVSIKDVASILLTNDVRITTDRLCNKVFAAQVPTTITLTKDVEVREARVWVEPFAGRPGEIVSTDLLIRDLAAGDAVRELVIDLNFDRDFVTLQDVDLAGTSISSWSVTESESGPRSMRLLLTSSDGSFASDGKLATISFRVYLSDSTATTIGASATLASERFCPLTLSAADSVTMFRYSGDLCGDDLLISVMRNETLDLKLAPNPASSLVRGEIALPDCSVMVQIVDVMGSVLHETTTKLSQGSFELALPGALPSGRQTLRVLGTGSVSSAPLMILR